MLALSDRQLVRDKVAHTLLLPWDQGRFGRSIAVNWNACALVAPAWPGVDFAVIGENGELLLVDPAGATRETSLRTLLPELRPGKIRSASVAGDSLWLVGGPGIVVEWQHPSRALDRSPAGGAGSNVTDLPVFETALAMPDGSLLCAGWDGEIWLLRDARWTRESSPTNLILSAAALAPDGTIYLVGQAGTLVKGRPGLWQVLPPTTEDNLWAALWFDGTLHACTSRQLMVLEDDELCTVGLPEDPDSFQSLSARKDILLTTGAHDVLLLLPDRMVRIA
ncbi:hypothetical protein OOT46_29265 [Aquabacterium sp. A7-Y]|uniref:hypothetical protein n=1 Tax=Aquabacterium sp. A7-Y TaxID=1349605 RepID=UPI00223E8DC5|nr:hypothetical protein [Aquabacterium sp. A7-Y]MCW7541892.1 hypothetical protein [Aquabacterium sp. A7-Y]